MLYCTVAAQYNARRNRYAALVYIAIFLYKMYQVIGEGDGGAVYEEAPIVNEAAETDVRMMETVLKARFRRLDGKVRIRAANKHCAEPELFSVRS